MLRCPSCGNEDEFIVDERVRQRTRIACNPDGSYDFVCVYRFIEVEEWGDMECLACSKVYGEEELRQEFSRAHGIDADGQPIPYTLMDASES